MKIRFSKQAWDDVTEIVRISDKEVGMMGLVEFIPKTKTYYVSNIFVPKQEVSAVTTDLDADSMARLENVIFEGQQKGIYPIKANLNAWIHSHVNMGVTWSGTDIDTIKEMAHYGLDREGLCVAIVVNKSGETRGAVCYNSGSNSSYVPSVFVDDISVEYDYIADLSDDWKAVLKEAVRAKEYLRPSIMSDGLVGYTPSSWRDDSEMWWERNKKEEPTEGKLEAGNEVRDIKGSSLGLTASDVPANEPEWLGIGELQLDYTDYELCWFENLVELEAEMSTAKKHGINISADEYDFWINRWRWINGI